MRKAGEEAILTRAEDEEGAVAHFVADERRNFDNKIVIDLLLQ